MHVAVANVMKFGSFANCLFHLRSCFDQFHSIQDSFALYLHCCMFSRLCPLDVHYGFSWMKVETGKG
ncbi:hypothetical protein ACFX13_006817 [Malus domestica]